MIFFVIDGSSPLDPQAVLKPSNFSAAYPAHRQKKLVAWNEVVPLSPGADPLAQLRAEITTAASLDPVCQQVLARLRSVFGLDPTVAATPSWDKTVQETLARWAHPEVGNISAIWGAAPVRPTGDAHFQLSWERAEFLDAGTKAAIQAARLVMPTLVTSPRDQVRLCFHINDLARAYVGEIASWLPRRLEKIFALELCLDPDLESGLKGVLTQLRRSGSVPESTGLRSTEYLRYYLTDLEPDFAAARPAAFADVLNRLWTRAIGDADTGTVDAGLLARTEAIFLKLPPVARLTVLINDIRKANEDRNRAPRLAVQTAHPGSPGSYRLGKVAPPIPLSVTTQVLARSGWVPTQYWTRDERHPATIFARTQLAPIWAGSSGHVAKNVAALGTSLPPASVPADGDLLLAAGLFAFWRLYYDTRYGTTHTLVEACDGTTDGLSAGARSFSLAPPAVSAGGSPYGLFRACTVRFARAAPVAIGGGPVTARFVDGLALLELLRARYADPAGPAAAPAAKIATAEAALTAATTAVTAAGYEVIQWSRTLDYQQLGMAAVTFRPPGVSSSSTTTSAVESVPQLEHATQSSATTATAAPDPRWGEVATFGTQPARIIKAVADTVTAAWVLERGSGPADDAWRAAVRAHRTAMATTSQDFSYETRNSPPKIAKKCVPFLVDLATDASQAGDPRAYRRASFELRFTDVAAIEELFNHPAGLRGHYYASEADGDRFTRDLITALQTILTQVRDDWTGTTTGDPHWLGYSAGDDFATAVVPGKVWMEPWMNGGMVTMGIEPRLRWMPRRQGRASRDGFIAALHQAEAAIDPNGSDGRVADFLRAASGDPGLLGPAAGATAGDNWRAQDQGSQRMIGITEQHVLLVKGVFLADGVAQEWFPLRKKYNSLSLYWLGYS